MARKTSKQRDEDLAAAYGRLSSQGQVTVRALCRAAGVSTEAARRFLADRATESEAPAIPQDVADVLAMVWGAAYRVAAEAAAEVLGTRLQEALDAQAADAETIAQATQEAATATQQAQAAVAAQKAAEQEAEQLKQQLTASKDELAQAREAAAAAQAAHAAAQATANTLQTAYDQLTTQLGQAQHKN